MGIFNLFQSLVTELFSFTLATVEGYPISLGVVLSLYLVFEVIFAVIGMIRGHTGGSTPSAEDDLVASDGWRRSGKYID